MTTNDPEACGRLRNLIHGIFAVWIRDSERQNPRAVYEEAINQRTRQYRELKEAVAGILYMRNKLEAEIVERRAEIARLHDDIRRAVRSGQDDLSVALIARKQLLLEDLERAESELDSVRSEAEEAKSNLVRFREEIRGLVQEKSRMLATLASAQARRRMSEAIEGLSVDADMKALEVCATTSPASPPRAPSSARSATPRPAHARSRHPRRVRDEAARRELVELKQQLHPDAGGAHERPGGDAGARTARSRCNLNEKTRGPEFRGRELSRVLTSRLPARRAMKNSAGSWKLTSQHRPRSRPLLPALLLCAQRRRGRCRARCAATPNAAAHA